MKQSSPRVKDEEGLADTLGLPDETEVRRFPSFF